MALLRALKRLARPSTTVEIVPRRIRLYQLTLEELEELTTPRLAVALAISGMCFGLLVAATVVLATISLDTRQLIGFTVAATASACGLLWSAAGATRACLKQQALRRNLLQSGNGAENLHPGKRDLHP